ncbi:SPOR domain-containing protein [Lysobacter sp. CFH 32150]|uniref:SPOR domain-containing protein n=1 Tax=Lysobacter sp. CFH 32150 TaxID=2927128 RepID=UPI001FA7860C|nr:SPOR domain-containing protein [Lysobacter sp. CFH 32150]MCI4569284.1 SPOR domain-containing protein [Lysobacter sp. CFH 32150]
METPLKQRLIGAAVLVALAVIFLPMLIQGPAPESGVSDVPLTPPDAPAGQYETRDLPLVAPGVAPDSGVVGMDASAPAPEGDNPDAADLATPVAPLDNAETTASPIVEEPTRSDTMFPAPTAGGNFAVNFGAFSTAVAADKLIASLRASQLPGYREAATVNGKTVQRVRIGPYATRAEAEAARLRAVHVRDDVGAKVVALDAEVETAAAKPAAVATTTTKPAETAKPAAPAAAKPAAPKPVAASNVGFALQLAAFSKAADATALRDKLRAAGFSAFTESVSTDKGTLTRVRVGPVLNRADADQLKAQVKSKLGMDGIVRPHP